MYAYHEVVAEEEVEEEAEEAENFFVMECWWKWLKDKKLESVNYSLSGFEAPVLHSRY